MDCNKEDAFRAKEIAERRFTKKDFIGAKKYAVKAQKLYPEMEGISQMLATFDVYLASNVRIDGEIDFYSVLGLNPSADEDTVKKQYKKLALILHPDKNKTVGADGAFKLVSEAWALLSDSVKRSSYDLRRNKSILTPVFPPTYYTVQTPVFHGLNNCSKPLNSHNQPKSSTFWTICKSCKVQYEYLRKYLNNKLSCKNCRKSFVAAETEPPLNGSVHFRSWSIYPEYGPANEVTYLPPDTIFLTGNGVPGFHSGITTEYQNISFQWSPFPGTSAGVIGAHGSVVTSSGVVHKAKEKGKGMAEKVKTSTKGKDLRIAKNDNTANISKPERPEKKRKLNGEYISRNGNVKMETETTNPEVRMANGDGKTESSAKVHGASEVPIRHSSIAPAFDARQLLIHKARKVIREKLEEMKLAAAEEKAKAQKEVVKSEELRTIADLGVSVTKSELSEPGSISITVPDSDFHDFDMERSEGYFKPKQIWALYDEEDGMPRLYCLIRQVISVKPFKIRISYLNSKSDCEFGLGSKSCGYFKAGNSDVIDQVNIFSHVICGEKKTGKGGFVQIFPKRGEIWAVYGNWSPDRNKKAPAKMKDQYEMVEVLDDYTEKLGVCVSPLVKVDGFRTVYQKKTDRNSIRWIPRREVSIFSHQVPSWVIKGEANLPDGCCDLDPAATPEDLLQALTEVRSDSKPILSEK
ncbi:DnaJ domain [Macleaya cordata]|uniref:DnaJ domain n=1 Tax=Macleaya cordata TaxID=56857 RepID=A0A200RBR5_MACCD|nr:DnaJ domain [Macleaya cordata]